MTDFFTSEGGGEVGGGSGGGGFPRGGNESAAATSVSSSDLEIFASMGFQVPQQVQQALDATNGNLTSAIQLLQLKALKDNKLNNKERILKKMPVLSMFGYSVKRRYTDAPDSDEWINYIDKTGQIRQNSSSSKLSSSLLLSSSSSSSTSSSSSSSSTSSTATSLGRILIRISGYEIRPDDVYFVMSITLKSNNINWDICRTYKELLSFKMSLPHFGNHIALKISSHFPMPRVFSRSEEEFLEKRRSELEVWFRGLCLSEYCMKSEVILKELSKLTGSEDLGFTDISSSRSNMKSAGRNLSARYFSSEPTFKVDVSSLKLLKPNRNYKIFGSYTNTNSRTMSLNTFLSEIPFKINMDEDLSSHVETIISSGKTELNKDESEHQLQRDYSGDRVIIQGDRILGYNTSVSEMCTRMSNAIYFVMESRFNISQAGGRGRDARGINFSVESMSRYCTDILRSASRTESAAISYFVIQHFLTDPNDSDFLIVPLSEIASPIELRLSLRERSLSTDESAKMEAIDKMYCRSFRRRSSLSPLDGATKGDENVSEKIVTEEGIHGKKNDNFVEEITSTDSFLKISSSKDSDIDDDSSDYGSCLSGLSQQSSEDSFIDFKDTVTHADLNLYHTVKNHPQRLDWQVICEAQATTAYGIINTETLKPVGHVKITYRKVTAAVPCLDVSSDLKLLHANSSESTVAFGSAIASLADLLTSKYEDVTAGEGEGEGGGGVGLASSLLRRWSIHPTLDQENAVIAFEPLNINFLRTKDN